MEQRLHALKVSLLEEKRRREEQRRQQQEAAGGGERKEVQSQRDYLRDMRQRLERKKEATREAVREVRQRMETLGREYVAPRRRKEDEAADLTAFQKASEHWLKEDEHDSKTQEHKHGELPKPAATAPAPAPAAAAAAAEEADVQADGGIVIDDQQDDSNIGSADPAFAKAREEWLKSLQTPHCSRCFCYGCKQANHFLVLLVSSCCCERKPRCWTARFSTSRSQRTSSRRLEQPGWSRCSHSRYRSHRRSRPLVPQRQRRRRRRQQEAE